MESSVPNKQRFIQIKSDVFWTIQLTRNYHKMNYSLICDI